MFFWDPNPEIFVIPIINRPILWYGLFFMLGFALGFPLFLSILRRFFFNYPKYTEKDILDTQSLYSYGTNQKQIVSELNKKMESYRAQNVTSRMKTFVKSSRCRDAKLAISRLGLDLLIGKAVLGIYRKSVIITDRLVVYILLATVFGARIGHFLFYEDPHEYLPRPWELLRVWEGKGLASHGAAIGIILALFLFSKRIKKITDHLGTLRLLDFVCIPTALAGAFIRLGNFFNQEILGSPTDLPWAVIFGHPADYSSIVPRHPVQIYESLFYFAVFFLLWKLSYRRSYLLKEGKIIGLFLFLIFGFRFAIEFLKEEQSVILQSVTFLTMGQILSIPMVILGLYFYFRKR